MKYDHLVHRGSEQPLSSVPFHADTGCIRRFFASTFPFHLAVHEVFEAKDVQEYTQLHHHDEDEINIVIGGPDAIEYCITLGDETFHVAPNTSIFIPAGLPHSANVVRGTGYYIAIRLGGKTS